MNIDKEILWQRLPEKSLDCKPHMQRVLRFDPSNIPNLFTPKPFQRTQFVSMEHLFPVRADGVCACGCGAVLSGKRKRWATDDCKNYATAVRFIVAGATATIATYLRRYYGWNCFKCGCDDKGHEMGANGVVSWIKIDHIIPVKHGGGACWLSNYQLLCHNCHVSKTNKDFNWRAKDSTNKAQISLFTAPNPEVSDTTDDAILTNPD